jgi:hypothetical protein
MPARWLDLLVFFALLLALGVTGWRIARRLLAAGGRGEGPLSTAVSGFTVAVAVGSLPAILLGHFGLLRPTWYLLTIAGIALATSFLRTKPGEAEAPAREGVFSLTWIEQAETALALAAAGALAVSILYIAWQLRFEPVGAFGGDDASYHMAAVATWMRHGDLRMMKFDFGDRSTPFYPILAEICSWVLLAPLRDSDFAARWTQLPFALASLVALAALGRRLGLSRRAAALAPLFYASIFRVLPLLAFTAGNDHTTAFLTLAALDGALATSRRPTAGRAALTGLALGLLVGTKYIGLFYAATVVLALLILLLAQPEGRALFTTGVGRRRLLALAGTLAGVALLAGGYTYLRNAWTAGNPLFPAPLRLLGHEIFPGWDSATLAYRRTRDSFRFDVWTYLTHRTDLFGPLFPYTLLPAALLAPLLALARLLGKPRDGGPGRDRLRSLPRTVDWPREAPEGARPQEPTEPVSVGRAGALEAAVVLSLPLVFFLEFMELMDDHRDLRYWLAGLGLLAVGLAWLTERLEDRVRGAGAALRAILLGLLLFLPPVENWIGLDYRRKALLALALLAAAALLVTQRERLRAASRRLPRRTGAVLAVAGLAILLLEIPRLAQGVDTYQRLKLRDRPAALALEQAAGPGGATVGYLAFNQPYLFFGSRLQNDVQIVPTTWDLGAQYYRFGGSAEFPFDYPEFRRFWRILSVLKVQYLVLRLSDGEEPQRGWILSHPDRFQPIYRDGSEEIYRVVRSNG